MKPILVAFLFLLSSFCARSEKIDTVWAGTLNYMNSELDLYFTLKSEGANQYVGYISVPSQGLRNLKLDTTSYEPPLLILVHNQLGMRYRGVFVMNGFLGDFSQNGVSIPLNLLPGAIPIPNRPQEPKPPFPYREEEVVFHNSAANIDLAGTFTIPDGEGPFPAVILVSGSGQQNRNEEIYDHKPFWVIADYLARNGIAVLRYDDRGVGKSGGNPAGGNTEDFSYDTESALNYLQGRSEVSKVGVCGHSEGGTIAFILAARNPDVDFVISLAGSAVRGDKLLLSQQKALGKAAGVSDSYLDMIEKTNSGLYGIVIGSEKPDSSLRKAIIEYVSSTPGASAGHDSLNAVADEVSNPWMYFFLRYDPSEAISKVRVPILALNGTNDLQVIANINLPNILKNADLNGNKNVTVKYLNGLNHLFQHSQTGSPTEYPTIEETFSQEVLQIIVEWIISLKIHE